MRAAVLCVLAAAALVGCGGSGGGAAAPSGVSAARAADEAVQTKRGLDVALEHYREGDRGAAADALRAVRGEHFALVRTRLRAASPFLARRLEADLGTDLPHLVDQGVTVTTLARRIVVVEDRLDEAADALRRYRQP